MFCNRPLAGGYAVPGLVCLGWEDMRAYVAAAEAERAPVILQAGPGCREHTPLPILGAMFRHLAEGAECPGRRPSRPRLHRWTNAARRWTPASPR